MYIRKSLLWGLGLLSVMITSAFQIEKSNSSEEDFTRAVESYITEVMEELKSVPGIAVSIVHEDKPLLTKGFGYADVKKKTKVNTNTNFYIASCTKSYTALLAAHLDQKGIIKLDDPITKYLPKEKFKQDLAVDQVTIRDLLRHTSGLENDPITYRLAYSGEHTAKGLIDLLQYTEANKVGRGQYQYSNFGYNLYTIISDKVTGKSWQDWLDEIIFQAAGMQHTSAYMSKVDQQNWNLAKPYMNLVGENDKEVYLIKTDKSMQSAGGLITTAEDASRWLQLQINYGKLDGKQLFPKEMIQYTHQKLTEAGGDYDEFGRAHYGLGWRIGSFHDHPNINHFGGYPGYLTHISFDPEAKLGVAILTNEGYWGDNLMNLFAAFIYDYWYSDDPEKVIKEYQKKKEKALSQIKKVSKRIAEGIDKRADRQWDLTDRFTAYSGTYQNPALGTVNIKGYEDRIEVRNGNLWCVATPFPEKNAIRVELVPGSGNIVQFVYKENQLAGLEASGLYFEKVE